MKNFFKGKIATVVILLATLVLAGVAIFTAVRLYQLRGDPVAPNAPESLPKAAGPGPGFTCTSANAGATCRTQYGGFPGNWDGQTCVLTVCPYGDTDGNKSCNYADRGAVVTYGNCFTNIQPQISQLESAKTCYQYDTVISTSDHNWCDLAAPDNTCQGYQDNLSTCVAQTAASCSLSFSITTPTATPTGIPTTTPTFTPTPSPVPQCNSSCATSSDCPSNLTCTAGSCRNPVCTSQVSCVCATGTPTATPTPTTTSTATPTFTPTPSPVPGCNSSCTTNTDCPSNLICYIASGSSTGNCRNTSCTSSSSCVCATYVPTPVPTQPALPQSGTSWPTVFGIGVGIITIIGSLILAL